MLEPELPDDPWVIPGAQGAQGAPGGGGAWTSFTQNLGTAARSGRFTLTGLTGLTVGEVREVVQTSAAISTKGDATDEPELDMIQLLGKPTSTTELQVTWIAPSVVVGTYAFAWR